MRRNFNRNSLRYQLVKWYKFFETPCMYIYVRVYNLTVLIEKKKTKQIAISERNQPWTDKHTCIYIYTHTHTRPCHDTHSHLSTQKTETIRRNRTHPRGRGARTNEQHHQRGRSLPSYSYRQHDDSRGNIPTGCSVPSPHVMLHTSRRNRTTDSRGVWFNFTSLQTSKHGWRAEKQLSIADQECRPWPRESTTARLTHKDDRQSPYDQTTHGQSWRGCVRGSVSDGRSPASVLCVFWTTGTRHF